MQPEEKQTQDEREAGGQPPEPKESSGLSGTAWFWIVVIVVIVAGKVFSPEPAYQFNPYDPTRDRAVRHAVEEAQIRSGFRLTPEQAGNSSSDAFQRQVQMERERSRSPGN